MAGYYVRGFTSSVTAVADKVLAALWNPAASRRITVLWVAAFATDFDVAGYTMYLTRITARGTAPSTATPGAVDADDNAVAPPSAASLDLGDYSVAPTASSPKLYSPGPGS